MAGCSASDGGPHFITSLAPICFLAICCPSTYSVYWNPNKPKMTVPGKEAEFSHNASALAYCPVDEDLFRKIWRVQAAPRFELKYALSPGAR